MNDYEQKKQDRIDRYRERADKARAESSALAKESHDTQNAIYAASAIKAIKPTDGSDPTKDNWTVEQLEQRFAAEDEAARNGG